MMRQRSKRMGLAPAMAVCGAAIAMFVIEPTRADVQEHTKQVGDTTVHYKVVLPNGYDPAKAYPAILAMGAARRT